MDRTKLMGIALLGVAVLVAGWTAWRAPVTQKASAPIPENPDHDATHDFRVVVTDRHSGGVFMTGIVDKADATMDGWSFVLFGNHMDFNAEDFDCVVDAIPEGSQGLPRLDDFPTTFGIMLGEDLPVLESMAEDKIKT